MRRPHGTGSIVLKGDIWVARVNLANGKKVIRRRRTKEDAEAAIAEIMRERTKWADKHRIVAPT